jgi:endo-1,4-beta-xylanase
LVGGTSVLTKGCSANQNQQAHALKTLNQGEEELAVERDLASNLAVDGDAPLKEHAAAKGLIYGAAALAYNLGQNKGFADSVARECGMLVPGLELKWKSLRPNPDTFAFGQSDWLADFAETHGMLLRGHTLVWPTKFPEWFNEIVNRQNAEQLLLNHIETVAGRYAGRMHSWDVVNEALDPSDRRSDGLRNTKLLELLGPDYIDLAFRATAAADPQALLVYNDYGFEYDKDSNTSEQKRTAVLKLLERLKSKGTPVHALGTQAHLRGHEEIPSQLRTFLRNVADLGLKILVTELDVADNDLPGHIETRDRRIAEVYEEYLTIMLDEPAVIAVITWGLSDRYTWLSQYPRRDGTPVRPLPLDAQMRRKPAWHAIARAFDNAPRRES